MDRRQRTGLSMGLMLTFSLISLCTRAQTPTTPTTPAPATPAPPDAPAAPATPATPTAPAAPATPAPPAAPAAPTDPATAPPMPAAPVQIETIVNDALAQATAQTDAFKAKSEALKLQGDALRIQGDTLRDLQRTLYLNSKPLDVLSGKRIDLDLKNTALRDALKQVLETAKVTYKIDDDVPNDTKVTLKISNTPLPAVLDLLTQANDIGWRSEIRAQVTRTLRRPNGISSQVFGDGNVSVSEDATTITSDDLAKKDSKSKNKAEKDTKDTKIESDIEVHVGKSLAIPNSFRVSVMDLKGSPFDGNLKFYTPPAATLPQTYVRRFNWQEQRTKFTCPNCHNTITIVRSPEAIKCPTCGRPFQNDWKVCPYDGTKRPERKDAWRYCPICGKPIKIEADQASWIVDPTYSLAWPNQAAYTYTLHSDDDDDDTDTVFASPSAFNYSFPQ